MGRERLSMQKVKELLRQKLLMKRSHREIKQSLKVGLGTITSVLGRAEAAGLVEWDAVKELSERAVEERLNPAVSQAPRSVWREVPDWVYVHIERKRPGVTLELLHAEYLEGHPGGYQYSQFCELYKQWRRRQRLTMRQQHRAGEKMFVDFSGDKPAIVDRRTGELIEMELFVAVLGASNYTYVEATKSQQAPDFIAAHTRALEHFRGVPAVIVPEYVARHIFGLMFPFPLCGRRCVIAFGP